MIKFLLTASLSNLIGQFKQSLLCNKHFTTNTWQQKVYSPPNKGFTVLCNKHFTTKVQHFTTNTWQQKVYSPPNKGLLYFATNTSQQRYTLHQTRVYFTLQQTLHNKGILSTKQWTLQTNTSQQRYTLHQTRVYFTLQQTLHNKAILSTKQGFTLLCNKHFTTKVYSPPNNVLCNKHFTTKVYSRVLQQTLSNRHLATKVLSPPKGILSTKQGCNKHFATKKVYSPPNKGLLYFAAAKRHNKSSPIIMLRIFQGLCFGAPGGEIWWEVLCCQQVHCCCNEAWTIRESQVHMYVCMCVCTEIIHG